MSIPIREGIQSKSEIEAGLRASLTELTDWMAAQPDAAFTQGPAGKWSAGQHLDHLVRSVQPLTTGLRFPKFVLGLVMGTMKRPSMTYAELAAKYEGVLDAGGKASGRYVPPAVAASRKAGLIRAHNAQRDTLLRQIASYSEADLDHYGAKHPLIGMLSMRELLFFTIHHHDHHLSTLKRDYA